MSKGKEFEVVVPIDASQIDKKEGEQRLQVLLIDAKGERRSDQITLQAGSKCQARFVFDRNPGKLSVLVGPADVSEEDLQGMQTIRRSVTTARLKENSLSLPAIAIGPFYWHYWPIWCRTFRIRGRVLCPDGSPVPGASVCAHDVDWFWWWSSKQQVGCATTDANGEFEITFKWCCGFWPWWWWKIRQWQLEPWLVERVGPLLREIPELRKIPQPTPKPDFKVFRPLLDAAQSAGPASATLDPSTLDALRKPLLQALPELRLIDRLQLWPWWPWYPWADCTPDIIFTVTQNCLGLASNVIIEESLGDVRTNIPQDLNVTLIAPEACCIEDDPAPDGDCVVVGRVCNHVIDTIAGNPGAAAPTPLGYLKSSSVGGPPSRHNDRPFGGRVAIAGVFGIAANADYYEFEWSDDGGTTWNTMPGPAAGGFNRAYWGPKVGSPLSDPADVYYQPFNFTTIDGRLVCETREHFEANNNPASWGTARFWLSNRDMLINWLTLNNFADGTYWLRIRTWQEAGGNLVNDRILPLCDTQVDNSLVLTIDNRVTGAGSGHPTSLSHPCGNGTVHTCTTEPDTDILRVLVDGVPVNPCDVISGADGKELKIEFLAHDPDGHLASFELSAHYGENLVNPLLVLATPTPGAGAPSPVPTAAQVGPDYGDALAQGASAPHWHGGTMTLTIPNMKDALPDTCAYQLELRVYKRTIVGCDNSFYGHWNKSEYSFTVQY